MEEAMKCIANYAILGVILACSFGPDSIEPAEASAQDLTRSEVDSDSHLSETKAAALKVPRMWEYSSPLIAPEIRDSNPSRAQKDPSVVFYDGKWHVFMTVKLQGKSAIEYCSFEKWEEADRSERTILEISKSNYYCAPQVFYFRPHRKWYLVYQLVDTGHANSRWWGNMGRDRGQVHLHR
jgi:hypothetical protein